MRCIFSFALTEEMDCPVIPPTAKLELGEFVTNVCQHCPVRIQIILELSAESEKKHKRKKK